MRGSMLQRLLTANIQFHHQLYNFYLPVPQLDFQHIPLLLDDAEVFHQRLEMLLLRVSHVGGLLQLDGKPKLVVHYFHFFHFCSHVGDCQLQPAYAYSVLGQLLLGNGRLLPQIDEFLDGVDPSGIFNAAPFKNTFLVLLKFFSQVINFVIVGSQLFQIVFKLFGHFLIMIFIFLIYYFQLLNFIYQFLVFSFDYPVFLFQDISLLFQIFMFRYKFSIVLIMLDCSYELSLVFLQVWEPINYLFIPVLIFDIQLFQFFVFIHHLYDILCVQRLSVLSSSFPFSLYLVVPFSLEGIFQLIPELPDQQIVATQFRLHYVQSFVQCSIESGQLSVVVYSDFLKLLLNIILYLIAFLQYLIFLSQLTHFLVVLICAFDVLFYQLIILI